MSVLYGVSVGPGDPELMTIKAINTIKKCDIIVFPGKEISEAVAYNIAVQMVPELADKILLPIEMPMSKDKNVIDLAHKRAVALIEKQLVLGKNVAFLVLGDATIFSTFMYLEEYVKELGYDTEIISGVTSFCASAAKVGISLCRWDENLVIVPSRHQLPKTFDDGKNYVLMKVGNCLAELKKKLNASERKAVLIENCGMEEERVYLELESFPDKTGYYSIVIVR